MNPNNPNNLTPQEYLANGGTLSNGQIPTIQSPMVPSTMDAYAIQTQNPMNLAPTPQDNTNYGATMEGIPDYKDLIKSINEPTAAESTAGDTRTRLQKIISSITGLGGSVSAGGDINTDIAKTNETENYIKGFGYKDKADATTQLRDVTGRISALKKEALAIPLQLQEQAKGLGVTAGGLAPEQTAQLRNNTIKSLALSSIAETIQGNLTTAADLANEAVNKEFAPIQAQLNAEMFNYQMNKDELTREDSKKAKILEADLNERKRILDDKKDDKKTIYGWAAEAAKNGAPSLLLSRAQESSDPQEVLSMLAPYMSDPTAKAQTLANLDKTRADIKKINNEITQQGLGTTLNGSQAGQFVGALQVVLGSTKLTKEQKTTMINAVSKGQDPATVIKNQAKNIMGQAEATKLTNYEVAKDVLSDIGDDLAAFYAAGGDTGLIKGNLETVSNKLGQVKDPNLVQLATKIKGNIQVYRNAVSGTAYSAQEGRDINSIFPGINNSKELNKAITDARSQLFDSIINSTYERALGKDAYAAVQQASSAKSNLTNQQFVEKAVQSSGKSYQDIISGAPKGQIAVVDNTTGQVGYIPVEEFNNTYTKL